MTTHQRSEDCVHTEDLNTRPRFEMVGTAPKKTTGTTQRIFYIVLEPMIMFDITCFSEKRFRLGPAGTSSVFAMLPSMLHL